MAKCDKLFEKAKNNPRGLRFAELEKLAECYGFRFDRQSATSHRIYKAEGRPEFLNLQPGKGGKAKDYQVLQLLRLIEKIERE